MSNVEIINGSRTSFGPRTTEGRLSSAVLTTGVKKQLVLPVVFDSLLAHEEGDVTGAALPLNALITGVYAVTASEDFVGGTSYDINLVEDDGTAVTTVATAVLADLNAGAEIDITDANVTAGPAYVELVPTGTFTAGNTTVVVEYIEQVRVA